MGGTIGPDAGFALEGDGLQAVTWDALDSISGGVLTASPADADGRGIALTVTRGGIAVDMTGAKVYLAWRHAQSLARGCVPFEAVDAASGEFRLFFPAAMAAAEGTAACQIIASWGERALSSSVFTVRVARVMTGGVDEECFNLLAEAIKRYEEACGLAMDAAEAARLAAEAVKQAAERGEFDGAPGAPGEPGEDGKDGASPSARVERVEGGALITVEDASGVTEAEIMDGVSPTVQMDSFGDYLMLTVVDAEGGHSAMIPHGDKGDPGVGCTHSWDGTVLTVTSASGTSSADLVGPVGPAGPRPTSAQVTSSSIPATNNAIRNVYLDKGAQVGDVAISDYDGGLGVVKSVEPHDDRRDKCTVQFEMCVRDRQLGTCTGMELEPGSVTDKSVKVYGKMLESPDFALSTDTGCLGYIKGVSVGYSDMVYADIEGIAWFATRAYVDGELAKLAAPDLSAYATREWVQGLFDALPDLTGVEF